MCTKLGLKASASFAVQRFQSAFKKVKCRCFLSVTRRLSKLNNVYWTLSVPNLTWLAFILHGVWPIEIRFVLATDPVMSRSPQIRMPRWPKTDKWGGKMYKRKYSLKNEIQRWRQCSGVPRGCVPRIRFWPLRCDYHSGVLIGAGGRRRSDWSVRVLANDVSTRIDR